MKLKKVFLGITVVLTCIISLCLSPLNLNSSTTQQQEVRTVTYSEKKLNDESMYAAFDKHCIEENDNGFHIMVEKKFDTSMFDSIDLVGMDSTAEVATVHYSITYFESENKIELKVIIVENGVELTETIPGLVTANESGEVDVLFADEEGIIWLSDLVDNELIDNTGWWSNFTNWVKSVATEIKNVIVKGLRLALNIAVNIIGLENGAKILSMYKDSYGIYHADFDAWQSLGGYNDLYDFVFNLGSSMEPVKSEFSDEDGDGKEDYILWGWKGDYWELGAGGELGIYRRLGDSEIWYVDKNLAIDMTLNVKYRKYSYSTWTSILNWNPKDYYQNDYSKQKQWWITGFNPTYANKGVREDQLRVEYTVKFVTKGYSSSVDAKLREAFKTRWVESINRWSYEYSTQTFSYAF